MNPLRTTNSSHPRLNEASSIGIILPRVPKVNLDILGALTNTAVRVTGIAVGANERRVAACVAEAWVGAGSNTLAGCACAAVVLLAGYESLFAVGCGGDDWGILASVSEECMGEKMATYQHCQR